MARLESGTYEGIVDHLERELELNALEESDDLPMATMASASTNQSNVMSNGINTNKDVQCSYCKATGHYYKSCPKLKKKKETEEKDGEKLQRPPYPPCDTCGNKNHSTERCWQGAGAHLRPKRPQTEQKDANASTSEGKPKTTSDSAATNSSQSNTKKTNSKKLILPRLQIHDYMSVRQYVISDPTIINYSQRIEETKGIPTVVWQQQMEKACIRTYKIVHNDCPDRFYEIDHTKDFETQFRPLPLIEDYHPQYPDPEYGKDPYWDDELYDRQNLQFRCDDYPPTVDKDDPQIENTKLSRALIELWQPNSEALIEEIEEPQHQEDYQGLNSFLVEQQGEPPYVPLSTNFGLKIKRRMLYFPMDFGELTLDGIIDTGAHSSAIPEADLRKTRLLAAQSIIKEGPVPSFQIMIANGDLETPKSTVELKFEVGTLRSVKSSL